MLPIKKKNREKGVRPSIPCADKTSNDTDRNAHIFLRAGRLENIDAFSGFRWEMKDEDLVSNKLWDQYMGEACSLQFRKLLKPWHHPLLIRNSKASQERFHNLDRQKHKQNPKCNEQMECERIRKKERAGEND